MTMIDLPLTVNFPSDLANGARVWIYQSTREFTDAETRAISEACDRFTTDWAAHGKNLTADYGIYFNRFICLFVDETNEGASGCSIDSSVHFIQEIERSLKVSLFGRTDVAYVTDSGEIETVHMNDVARAKELGHINGESIVFNNLVATLGEMKSGWMVPISNSWHARLLR